MEAGSLPPAWPGPDQMHPCFVHVPPSEKVPGRETRHNGKIKGGQVKVTLLPKKKKKKRLNSRLLYLLSVEINKVLGLQICWYGGLDDMTKGRVGRETGGAPGRPARWAPLGHLAVWPGRTMPPMACGACGPRSPALASPFLKGLSARAGTSGQSSGPTA